VQQICFLIEQKPRWSDHWAIWALALVQRDVGRQKTRCDGKLLILLLIKGHFLSAISGGRLAYLGLDCVLSRLPPPPALPLRHSSSCGEKHQRSAEADAKETLPHNWCVWHVCLYATSLWPLAFDGAGTGCLKSPRVQSDISESLLRTDLAELSWHVRLRKRRVNGVKQWGRWLVQI